MKNLNNLTYKDLQELKTQIAQIEPQKQLEEIEKCATDPVYFINEYVKIYIPSEANPVSFKLYDYQEVIINSFYNNRFNIIKAPRQSSKTLCGLLQLLHFVIFNSGKTVVIKSFSNSSTLALLERFKALYENVPDFLKPGVSSNTNEVLKFENFSTVRVAIGLNRFHGMNIDAVFLDEMAYMPRNLVDEFFNVVGPCLAADKTSKINISSTIREEKNKFDEIFENDSSFTKLTVRYTDMPMFRDPVTNLKESIIRNIGLIAWNIQYENKRQSDMADKVKEDCIVHQKIKDISDKSIKIVAERDLYNFTPTVEIKMSIKQEDLSFLKMLLGSRYNTENEKNLLLFEHLSDRLFNFLVDAEKSGT
jgi:hypothetical protein